MSLRIILSKNFDSFEEKIFLEPNLSWHLCNVMINLTLNRFGQFKPEKLIEHQELYQGLFLWSLRVYRCNSGSSSRIYPWSNRVYNSK